MTVNHPQWGTMCEICFHQLTPDKCAVDADGVRWDVCAGDCAEQAGISEATSFAEQQQINFDSYGVSGYEL